jgi:aspartate aminotransferase
VFTTLEAAEPDAILGLNEVFKQDPNPNKINLTVGVYKDANGSTPVLPSVHEAEKRLWTDEKTKGYLPIEGSAEFGAAVRALMFGADHSVIEAGRAATAHTPGGTGALRVAADFIQKKLGSPTVWVSDPTWPNHPSIFQAAGLQTKVYPYFDAAKNELAFDRLLDTLGGVGEGAVVVLHGCCHNPTGIDPTPDQWKQIGKILKERKALPLLDFAYQGFGDGLKEDAQGLLALCDQLPEMLVCSSFSKNFSLYNERVGALTVLAENADGADKALGHVRGCIRANYSNPPAHGAAIVTRILGDEILRSQWEAELKGMRDRIQLMRELFVKTLKAKGVEQDFSFIARQKGMFSFSGLTKEHVAALRAQSIYVVGSGRINVAAMTEANMEPLCTAIAAVLKA